MKPREKFSEFGITGLSDHELVSILLGSGVKGNDIASLATKVLEVLKRMILEKEVSLERLNKIKGVGKVKAQRIVAALELGRRLYVFKEGQLLSSRDVWILTRHLASDSQEKVMVLYLNGRNELLESKEIAKGRVNSAYIDNRVIFKRAIELMATGIILVHNHPSGDLRPSDSDISTTQMVRSACELFGINLIDHIIITSESYCSIAKECMVEK